MLVAILIIGVLAILAGALGMAWVQALRRSRALEARYGGLIDAEAERQRVLADLAREQRRLGDELTRERNQVADELAQARRHATAAIARERQHLSAEVASLQRQHAQLSASHAALAQGPSPNR